MVLRHFLEVRDRKYMMVTFPRRKKCGNQTRFSCFCILLQRLSAAYSEKHELWTSYALFQITSTNTYH